MEKFLKGQQIETTVVQVSADSVFVDLNSKSEGIIDKAEFIDSDGKLKIQEGDKIKVFYLGEINGEFRFTSRLSSENSDFDMLENAFQNKIPVEGKVEKEIKGGFEVSLGGKRAFCPYSQMGFKEKKEPSYYVGRVLTFLITEFKENAKNILVSNKQILQQEYENHLDSLKNSISVGNVVEGTVKSLQNYGAFVEIDGFQALLPASEVSYEKINDLSEVLKIGQKVSVKVIKADWSLNRVSVSLKALEENPWDSVEKRFKVGQKIDGKISRVQDFGIFVNLAKGIDGLVHISALNVERNTNIKKVYSPGDDFAVQIKEIDADEKRISLIPASTSEEEKTAKKFKNYEYFCNFFCTLRQLCDTLELSFSAYEGGILCQPSISASLRQSWPICWSCLRWGFCSAKPTATPRIFIWAGARWGRWSRP